MSCRFHALVFIFLITGCRESAPKPILHEAEPPPSAPSEAPPGRTPDVPRPATGGRVAVVAPLHVNTGNKQDAALGELLGEILAIALSGQKDVAVVERRRLDAVLQEQKLGLSGLVDPSTAARIGKLLLADLVVAGSIVETDGKLRYAVHVIAVDGQRVLGSVQLDGTRGDFDRSALELSARLAPLAGVRLPPVKPEELDDSPVGRLHLMRGVSLFYANNDDQAIISCLRTVQLDPRLHEARLWIARAYLRQGEKEPARAELRLLKSNPAAGPLAAQVDQLLKECGPEPPSRN